MLNEMDDTAAGYARQIVDTINQPLVVLAGDLRVEMVNRAFCRTFEVSAGDSRGQMFYDLGNGQWNIEKLRELLENVLTEQSRVDDYRVEHEFPDIGRRVMLLNAQRMDTPDGERILLAIADRTQEEKARHDLEGAKEFADKLIDSVRDCLLVLDWELRVRHANEPFYTHFKTTPGETEGNLVYDLGNGQWDIPELREALERVLPESWSFNDYEMEHTFETIGKRIMRLNGRKLDHLDLIILAIRDVTDARRFESSQKVFMGELQHRVRNLMNNVMALARNLRRRSDHLDDFNNALMPRLQALARSQTLLMNAPNEDVAIADILRSELDAVGAEKDKDYSMRGPDIGLPPRKAQAMGMAIHELATNAGKHGALKKGAGQIEINWEIVGEQAPQLDFRWRERGVSIDPQPSRSGFGYEVIESSLPYMLNGSASLTLHPDGAECRVTFPLEDTKGMP